MVGVAWIIYFTFVLGSSLKCYDQRKGHNDSVQAIIECSGKENVCYRATAQFKTEELKVLAVSLRGCGVSRIYCDVCRTSVDKTLANCRNVSYSRSSLLIITEYFISCAKLS